MINIRFPLQPHQKYNITQYGQPAGFSRLTRGRDDHTTAILTAKPKRWKGPFWAWEWKGYWHKCIMLNVDFLFQSLLFSCSSKVRRVDKTTTRDTIGITVSRGAVFIWRLVPFRVILVSLREGTLFIGGWVVWGFRGEGHQWNFWVMGEGQGF